MLCTANEYARAKARTRCTARRKGDRPLSTDALLEILKPTFARYWR